MGSNSGDPHERPVHTVHLASFAMDVTEVTVDHYAACVRAGDCSIPDTDSEFCNWGKSAKGDHPINCVDWDQATEFCSWAGKRLPTEEEWEYAARGTDGRTYPWGNASPFDQLCWKKQGTCEVGSYESGKSPFGLDDMAGNVWEWTSTENCVSYSSRVNCKASRVNRGGGWNNVNLSWVRVTSRFRYTPSSRHYNLGFRCAR